MLTLQPEANDDGFADRADSTGEPFPVRSSAPALNAAVRRDSGHALPHPPWPDAGGGSSGASPSHQAPDDANTADDASLPGDKGDAVVDVVDELAGYDEVDDVDADQGHDMSDSAVDKENVRVLSNPAALFSENGKPKALPGFVKPPPGAGVLRGLGRPPVVVDTSAAVRLMVLVVTGGTKAATLDNRQTVLETWADNDTYLVTRDAVKWPHVIRLPAEAEEGGMNLLSRKVLHMWEHVAREWTDRYDWFIKADDDTYINLPRLRQDLALLDPQAPAYLGSKRFGGGARGTPGPGPLWQNKNYMKFAHGGAG